MHGSKYVRAGDKYRLMKTEYKVLHDRNNRESERRALDGRRLALDTYSSADDAVAAGGALAEAEIDICLSRSFS